MNSLNVLCLGSMDMRPVYGNDCTSFLVNGHALIDCGTSPVMNLLNAGVDFQKIDSVIFTHLHMDHCVGFASLVFLFRTRKIDVSRITVFGPKGETEAFVERTFHYLGLPMEGNSPTVVEIDEDEFSLPGDDGIILKSTSATHAVKGLCLRLTASDKSVGFSGDTFYMEKLGQFFSGVDALIHECSFDKPKTGCEQEHLDFKKRTGHSDVADAVRVASESNAKSLYLVHSFADHEKQEAWLREICSLNGKFLHYKDEINI